MRTTRKEEHTFNPLCSILPDEPSSHLQHQAGFEQKRTKGAGREVLNSALPVRQSLGDGGRIPNSSLSSIRPRTGAAGAIHGPTRIQPVENLRLCGSPSCFYALLTPC